MNVSETEHHPRTKRLPLVLILVASLSAGLFGGIWIQRNKASIEDVEATVLEPAAALEKFELTTHSNTPFTNQSLTGKWSFMFFGFTNCPDVCPTTLHTMAQVDRQIMQETNGEEEIQVVFVSVDPERDTPERLAQYVPYFNESFIGVTGKRADINRFTRQLGILHVRVERDGDDDYLVNHSASILLFNPEGQLRALFSAVPHQAAYIIDNFLKIARL